jgi:hypothetical protein
MVTIRLSSGAVSLLLLPSSSDEYSCLSLLAACVAASWFVPLGVGVNAVPHSMQNFAFGKLTVPQFGQMTRRFPHSRQNFAFGGLIVWQFGQRISILSFWSLVPASIENNAFALIYCTTNVLF